MAIPIPPPMQRVAQPLFLFCFIISWIRVTKILVPEAPIGCPNAIAPPLTFTIFLGILRSLITAILWAAAQSIAVIRDLKIPKKIVNVNGGAIALGHPIGASGTRILVTLIHEMIKQNKNKGCATLCIGGGMGIAMCIERN